MATLSKTSDIIKDVAKIGAIGIIALVLLVVIFQVGILIKNLVAPTPAAPPTVTFGKLSSVSFPQSNTTNYSYSVNTLSGNLPTLPDRITVYKMQQSSPNLLGLDNAKTIARAAEFTTDPTAISDTTYKWSNPDNLAAALTMNIQSFDFFYTSNYKTDPTITQSSAPDETVAQTVSGQFFDKVMPLPKSIDENKTKLTLFAIQNNTLTPASSLSTAQVVRIDYFPQAIDNLPIYTANPTESLLYSILAAGNSNYPQVVEAQYIHKEVGSDKATYPIKSATQAFDELKQGKGYVAANPTEDTNVTITNVSLGYYESPTAQDYLWPIIVFQGDKGFYAYVSAITDQWIK